MPKVLVVEDDAAIREMMRRRLAMRGFDVRVATNGVEALEVASEYRPDTILLDLELPDGMNGWDVARILRSDPRTAATRIFVITAHVTAPDMERAGRIGCTRFFGKPVDFRALVEALGGAPALAESR
jgi:two-component system cell cycle response regulator DivK